MTSKENERLARRFPEEAATGGDVDVLDEILADDFVDHSLFGREVVGVEASKAQLRAILTAFPDFEATVEDVVAEGDRVAMRVTLSGTHEGEFMGLEPTGNSFEVGNAVFNRVADGRIVERWTLPDTFGMLQQLGVLPADLLADAQTADD